MSLNIPRDVVQLIIDNIFRIRTCLRCGEYWVIIGVNDTIYCTAEHPRYIRVRSIKRVKSLRATASCFARVYSPIYITITFGGSFGRIEYSNIIRYNTIFCHKTLREIAGMYVTEQVLRQMASLQYACNWVCRYRHGAHNMHINASKIHDHRALFIASPTLIFNNKAVSLLLEAWPISAEMQHRTLLYAPLRTNIYDKYHRTMPASSGGMARTKEILGTSFRPVTLPELYTFGGDVSTPYIPIKPMSASLSVKSNLINMSYYINGSMSMADDTVTGSYVLENIRREQSFRYTNRWDNVHDTGEKVGMVKQLATTALLRGNYIPTSDNELDSDKLDSDELSSDEDLD